MDISSRFVASFCCPRAVPPPPNRLRNKPQSLSESFWKPRLLENCVRSVARSYLCVYHESAFGEWAVPDVMVTLTVPFEATASIYQEAFQCCGKIASHHAAWRRAVSNLRNRSSNATSSSAGHPFSSSNSGIMTFSLAIKSSTVSASVAKPCMSSLSANQTLAFGSQSALTSSTFVMNCISAM